MEIKLKIRKWLGLDNEAITSIEDNPIYKSTLAEHDGWWISDVALQLYQEGISHEETILCMDEQGFLD